MNYQIIISKITISAGDKLTIETNESNQQNGTATQMNKWLDDASRDLILSKIEYSLTSVLESDLRLSTDS